MTDTTRCRRCRRVLRDPEWIAAELGRVCAARLGLVRAKRVRVARPVRVDVEQPSLLDQLEEINEEME